ncbi:hypothetical protein GOODEAATRI_021951, partial [Goodea atripinnis]
ELMDLALSLASEGDRLIENSHYAEDCIRPKCIELRGVCEEIGSTLRSKKNLLLRAMELHHALEKAFQWCEDGIFLLANQPVDRCQSQDGAEAALQELERYLDTAAVHTITDRSAICCQYEAVLNPQLGMKDLQIYEAYCQNKPRSESLWRQCSDCAFFQECQKKLEHKLGLDSYLLKPVQRITKYQLLLKELLKYSKGCDGASDLQEALSSILGILKAVNDSMHLIAITGYEGNLSDLGRLLMQGSFSVWTEHKKGHAKVKDLARFKPMQRHLFLHEKALLFCKRREENGEGYEKAPSYSFKHSLSVSSSCCNLSTKSLLQISYLFMGFVVQMSAVGITENAKGDNKKFEIWCNSREEVFIVQVTN